MRLWGTPVPIPNTMVKTQAAEDTVLETAWESRWLPALQYGGVAQLGEHLPCKQGVKSSNLSVSTVWKQTKETYLENSIQNKEEPYKYQRKIENKEDIQEKK